MEFGDETVYCVKDKEHEDSGESILVATWV